MEAISERRKLERLTSDSHSNEFSLGLAGLNEVFRASHIAFLIWFVCNTLWTHRVSADVMEKVGLIDGKLGARLRLLASGSVEGFEMNT